jgi:phage shock protein PspC (stress-responsive transcriptional regulator)
MPERKRLTRSHDRRLGGVCGGLADYFDIDPTLVRVLFVLSFFLPPVGGTVVLAYLVLWLIMPAPQGAPAAERMDLGGSGPDGALILGVILLGAGMVFLFGAMGMGGFWGWGMPWFGVHLMRMFWPAALIAAGVLIIMASRRNA